MTTGKTTSMTVTGGDIVYINGKEYYVSGYIVDENNDRRVLYGTESDLKTYYIDKTGNLQSAISNGKYYIDGKVYENVSGRFHNAKFNKETFEIGSNDRTYMEQSMSINKETAKKAIEDIDRLITKCRVVKDDADTYIKDMKNAVNALYDRDEILSSERIEELTNLLIKFRNDLVAITEVVEDFSKDKDAAQNNWANKAKWYEDYYKDPSKNAAIPYPTAAAEAARNEKAKELEKYYGSDPEEVGRYAILNTSGGSPARNMVSDEEEDVSDDDSSSDEDTPSGYPTGGGTTTSSTEAPTEKPTVPPTDKRDNPFEKPTETPTEKPTVPPTEKPTERPTEVITQPTTPPTSAPTTPPTEAPKPTPSGNGGNNNGGGNSNGNGGNWYTGGNSNNNNSSSSTTNVEKPTEVPTVADDVIKKGNTYKLPTSSKPVTTTTTTTTSNKGNSAIPVLAGLAAAAAAGIGAKAYIDRKNNRDNDEEAENFKAEDWSNNTDINIEYQEPQAQKEETLDFDDNGYEQEETEKYGARTHQELEDLQ